VGSSGTVVVVLGDVELGEVVLGEVVLGVVLGVVDVVVDVDASGGGRSTSVVVVVVEVVRGTVVDGVVDVVVDVDVVDVDVVDVDVVDVDVDAGGVDGDGGDVVLAVVVVELVVVVVELVDVVVELVDVVDVVDVVGSGISTASCAGTPATATRCDPAAAYSCERPGPVVVACTVVPAAASGGEKTAIPSAPVTMSIRAPAAMANEIGTFAIGPPGPASRTDTVVPEFGSAVSVHGPRRRVLSPSTAMAADSMSSRGPTPSTATVSVPPCQIVQPTLRRAPVSAQAARFSPAACTSPRAAPRR
jgi:hypothetical protein